MIARTWRGTTRVSDADAYIRYLEATAMPAFAGTPGNVGAMFLQRPAPETGGAETEFLVISLWESLRAIERFAGVDTGRAVFYPEDERFLVQRDATVDHFDVVAFQGMSDLASARLAPNR